MLHGKIPVFVLVAGLCAIVSGTALATNYYWNVADGDWGVTSNWSPGGTPASADRAYIENDGTVRITTAAAARYVYIGNNSHNGTLFQAAGSLDVQYFIYLGYTLNYRGEYNLSSGSVSAARLYVGNYGSGEFNQSGGACAFEDYVHIAHTAQGSGTYNLFDGTLSTAEMQVGSYGAGEFNQSGGTSTITTCLRLGYYSQSASGMYNLSAGTISTPEIQVGHYGYGEFNQSGGTAAVNYLSIAMLDGSSGSCEMSGGELLVANDTEVGLFGEAGFEQTGGVHNVSGTLYIGRYGSSSGEYAFLGGSLDVGDLYIINGWMDIDLDAIDYFRVAGDRRDWLDGYIAEGKIFDSSYEGDIWAEYDVKNDWTTLAYGMTAVPEPGTIAMIAAGALGLAGAVRRKMR